MIIDNLANTQEERFTPFLWLSRSKGMTVDIWIRDYNPPRCFQKKISGRRKHDSLKKFEGAEVSMQLRGLLALKEIMPRCILMPS
jgi:hypothetical protein